MYAPPKPVHPVEGIAYWSPAVASGLSNPGLASRLVAARDTDDPAPRTIRNNAIAALVDAQQFCNEPRIGVSPLPKTVLYVIWKTSVKILHRNRDEAILF